MSTSTNINASPNVIFVITDDQGFGDLSCMGSADLQTPHLDALAERGVLLTSFYSNAPVCSPARAALLSGRYPGNAGVRSIIAGHRQATGLPSRVKTAGKYFQEAGYDTFFTGKWHLGLTAECRPDAHGFSHWFGFLAGCVDYYSHIFYWGMNRGDPGNDPTHDLWEDGREVWHDGEYLTETITRKTLSYLEKSIDAGRPFFGYVAYNAPHYPMHAPEAYLARFPNLSPERRIMAAMIAAVDDGIGEITDLLHRRGQLENTLIVFVSDNGPSRETRNWLDGRTDPYQGGSTGGLRGHKFSLFEGGVRVPGIISWPAGLKGGTRRDDPVAAFDLLPTVIEVCGLEADGEHDGTSLSHWLQHPEAVLPERDIFWEQGGQTAVRRGPWKLVLNGQEIEQAQPTAEVFLSNLETDPQQRVNLFDQHRPLADELAAAAREWRNKLEQRWTCEWQPAAIGVQTKD